MKRGFTLIELMIVVVIIGIIAALAVPNFIKIKALVYQNKMKNTIRMIAQHENIYYLENGYYMPGNENETSGYYIRYPDGSSYSSTSDTFFTFKLPDNVKYLYYIYWYKSRRRGKKYSTYCYVIANASLELNNDIDGDATEDYWYATDTNSEPRAVVDDLED